MQTAVPPGGVDPSALHSFAALAGVASAQEVVDVYLASATDRLAAIHDGLGADSPTAVRHAAHSLTSAAGAVGATRVATLTAALEMASIGGWSTPPVETVAALTAAVAESRERLAAVLAELAALDTGVDPLDAMDEADAEGDWFS